MKKLLSMVLVGLLLMGTIAYADETPTSTMADKERVYTACSGGNGIHQMYRRGNGWVECNGEYVIENKPCWQCKNCYAVMVTSDDPTVWNGIVGYYATKSYNYEISRYGTYITVNDYSYCGSKQLEGYKFYNN